jgi:hypothetical protein
MRGGQVFARQKADNSRIAQEIFGRSGFNLAKGQDIQSAIRHRQANRYVALQHPT